MLLFLNGNFTEISLRALVLFLYFLHFFHIQSRAGYVPKNMDKRKTHDARHGIVPDFPSYTIVIFL